MNTQGYDITEVGVLAGASDARANQIWTLTFSTVGSSDFNVYIGMFQNLEFNSASHGNCGTYIRVTDNTGVLARNVDAVRFDIGDGMPFFGSPGSYYREFDVMGTPTPEPATMALVGLGLAGLIARRRGRK